MPSPRNLGKNLKSRLHATAMQLGSREDRAILRAAFGRRSVNPVPTENPMTTAIAAPAPADPSRLLNLKQASEYLAAFGIDVLPGTVRKWCAKGRIRSVKLIRGKDARSNSVRVRVEVLDRVIAYGGHLPAPKRGQVERLWADDNSPVPEDYVQDSPPISGGGGGK